MHSDGEDISITYEIYSFLYHPPSEHPLCCIWQHICHSTTACTYLTLPFLATAVFVQQDRTCRYVMPLSPLHLHFPFSPPYRPVWSCRTWCMCEMWCLIMWSIERRYVNILQLDKHAMSCVYHTPLHMKHCFGNTIMISIITHAYASQKRAVQVGEMVPEHSYTTMHTHYTTIEYALGFPSRNMPAGVL